MKKVNKKQLVQDSLDRFIKSWKKDIITTNDITLQTLDSDNEIIDIVFEIPNRYADTATYENSLAYNYLRTKLNLTVISVSKFRKRFGFNYQGTENLNGNKKIFVRNIHNIERKRKIALI